MIKLAPSILSADFANLQRDCELAVLGGADYIHVDIMDGHFVPNLTIGPPVVERLHRGVTVPLDVHLMVDNPCQYISDLCQGGAGIITVHIEAFDQDESIMHALRMITQRGVRAGLSLCPNTPPQRLLPFLEEISLVLVMLVQPGFGGQSLIPEMLDKVRQIRSLLSSTNPRCELEVDGGVRIENMDQVVSAGANVIVAGSAVFNTPDITSQVRALKRKMNESGAAGYGIL